MLGVFLFIFLVFLSDGTKAEVACPPAAVGGGVGAERTRSGGQRSQTRGESAHKGSTIKCAVHGAWVEMLLGQHEIKERKQQM